MERTRELFIHRRFLLNRILLMLGFLLSDASQSGMLLLVFLSSSDLASLNGQARGKKNSLM